MKILYKENSVLLTIQLKFVIFMICNCVKVETDKRVDLDEKSSINCEGYLSLS
jgi:hypothetical protein